MAHELIVRFHPHGGGNWVGADVFLESLKGIVDGMHSVARVVSPVLAQRHAWSRGLVDQALTLAIGAVRPGSLEVAVSAGGSAKGVPFEVNWIERVGVRSIAMATQAAASGRTTIADIPLVAARSFERGAAVARDANVTVSLVERRPPKRLRLADRTLMDFTALAPGLASYAARREQAERSVTQLVGQLLVIRYDPPSFEIATGRGKLSVAMPARLRTKAQGLWGQEAIVLVEARVDEEGLVRDAKALDITPAAGAPTDDEFDSTFGALRDVWGTPEAVEYIDSLRGRG